MKYTSVALLTFAASAVEKAQGFGSVSFSRTSSRSSSLFYRTDGQNEVPNADSIALNNFNLPQFPVNSVDAPKKSVEKKEETVASDEGEEWLVAGKYVDLTTRSESKAARSVAPSFGSSNTAPLVTGATMPIPREPVVPNPIANRAAASNRPVEKRPVAKRAPVRARRTAVTVDDVVEKFDLKNAIINNKKPQQSPTQKYQESLKMATNSESKIKAMLESKEKELEDMQAYVKRSNTVKQNMKSQLDAREKELLELKASMETMTKELEQLQIESKNEIAARDAATEDLKSQLSEKSAMQQKRLKDQLWEAELKLESAKLEIESIQQLSEQKEASTREEYEEKLVQLHKKHANEVNGLYERIKAEEAFYNIAKADFQQAINLVNSDFMDVDSLMKSVEAGEINKDRVAFLEQLASMQSSKQLDDLSNKHKEEIASLEEKLKSEQELFAKSKAELEAKIDALTNEFTKEKADLLAQKETELAALAEKSTNEMNTLRIELEGKLSALNLDLEGKTSEIESLTKELEETKSMSKLEIKNLRARHHVDVEAQKNLLEKTKATAEEEKAKIQSELDNVNVELGYKITCLNNDVQEKVDKINSLVKELEETKDKAKKEISRMSARHHVDIEAEKALREMIQSNAQAEQARLNEILAYKNKEIGDFHQERGSLRSVAKVAMNLTKKKMFSREKKVKVAEASPLAALDNTLFDLSNMMFVNGLKELGTKTPGSFEKNEEMLAVFFGN
ncbi:predicted protein [Chaetoceros tenuissimus]|uniref:Uncharacterized protein n=1 Tax=Chaetoceros tenuissimus TaxID=426638 RepID=A0AAD3CUJ4_9STRA|nr:predicted protein [Chaetoceros tenuissimus]